MLTRSPVFPSIPLVSQSLKDVLPACLVMSPPHKGNITHGPAQAGRIPAGKADMDGNHQQRTDRQDTGLQPDRIKQRLKHLINKTELIIMFFFINAALVNIKDFFQNIF